LRLRSRFESDGRRSRDDSEQDSNSLNHSAVPKADH
jgi:hypothetical protein